ncbi:MAG: ABC transporter permease [Pseudomonadota bacterium]
MVKSYLIARREYLSYVATWGFWLSLISVPVIMVVFGSLPLLVQSSQPTRYYVIIDETGAGYDDIVQASLESGRRERAREALTLIGRAAGDDALQRALAAFDRDPVGLEGLPAALAELGVDESAGAFAEGFGRQVRVTAPAQSAEGLHPYLLGQRSIDTPTGPGELYGAIIIRQGEDRPLAVDYLSVNIAEADLGRQARNALERRLRRDFLVERGLQSADIDQLNALRPPVRNLDPSSGDEEDAAVTLADRAPFAASIMLAWVLWISVFSVANMLLTSLIEEKSGKILEVLLSTARFHEIIIGKLAGVAAVSFTLFAVWGLVGGLAMVVGGAALATVEPELAQAITAAIEPGLLLAALGYFVIGYLMFGAIFLAIGSLCETLQEAQSLMSPVILFLMAPMLILAVSFTSMDSAFVQFASWVPVWTPFLMMARLPYEPGLTEILATSALMLVTMVAVLWGAAAVFRQGALSQANVDSVKRFFQRKKRKSG